MEDELHELIKKNNCIPGINYVSLYDDKKTRWIFEIYLKNLDEYKVVGVWHHDDKTKLDKYSKKIYEELKKQGMNESGCMFLALEVKNEKEYREMMDYLISIRDKNVSYTDVWNKKNKIIKYDFDKVNRIKVNLEKSDD